MGCCVEIDFLDDVVIVDLVEVFVIASTTDLRHALALLVIVGFTRVIALLLLDGLCVLCGMKLHSSNADATRKMWAVSVNRVTVHARTDAFDRVHDEVDQSTDDRLEKTQVICVLQLAGRSCGNHANGTSTLRATVTRHTSST